MEINVKSPLKINTVKSVDKLMILVYNLVLVVGACYLIYYKDASAWLFALVILLAGSWSEKDKE